MTTPTLSTVSPAAQYQPAPGRLVPPPNNLVGRGRGCGEVKAHNLKGIIDGVYDLLNEGAKSKKCPPSIPRQPGRRILITYLPVKKSSRPPHYTPKNSGPIERVLVMATSISSTRTADDYRRMPREEMLRSVLAQEWYLVEDMQMEPKAKEIAGIVMNLTARTRAQFGNLMETLATEAFNDNVLKKQQPRRRLLRDIRGGSGHGTDVLWDELAGLYGELARELGNPFFAELASELAAYGQTQRRDLPADLTPSHGSYW